MVTHFLIHLCDLNLILAGIQSIGRTHNDFNLVFDTTQLQRLAAGAQASRAAAGGVNAGWHGALAGRCRPRQLRQRSAAEAPQLLGVAAEAWVARWALGCKRRSAIGGAGPSTSGRVWSQEGRELLEGGQGNKN